MIGVFDSGIGGLTVLRSFFKILPKHRFCYLGDTARVPYGNRSAKLIYSFSCQGIDFLFQQGCRLIIIACNTASAEALRRIQQEYLPKKYPERRVLGVIRPLAENAARITKNFRVGVVGTRGTIESGAYIRELKMQNENIQVFQKSCPLLVPLIEECWRNRVVTRKIVKEYLRPLKEQRIDTLILGCTHYQMLYPLIQEMMGPRCRVIDPGETVAQSLKDYLSRHPEIDETLIRDNQHRFFVTDVTSAFINNANIWLGKPIHLEKVEI